MVPQFRDIFPIRTALSAAFLLALSGCGISAPVISVTPLQSHEQYRETFTRAYATRDAAGDYEVVLLNDPLDNISPGDAGQPINPSPVPPIRQVLEIRLLWRPVAGAKPDSPAASNASLHWYVLGAPTTAGVSIIHYAGTAFVAVVPNGPGAEVTIRNGFLKTIDHCGELTDPLKSFAIEGRFDALADTARLRQIQADVNNTLAEVSVKESKTINAPPPRPPLEQ